MHAYYAVHIVQCREIFYTAYTYNMIIYTDTHIHVVDCKTVATNLFSVRDT